MGEQSIGLTIITSAFPEKSLVSFCGHRLPEWKHIRRSYSRGCASLAQDTTDGQLSCLSGKKDHSGVHGRPPRRTCSCGSLKTECRAMDPAPELPTAALLPLPEMKTDRCPEMKRVQDAGD